MKILLFFLIPGFAFAQLGINTKTPLGIFHIDGNKNNNSINYPTPFQQIDDFIITHDGNVGIGTLNPHESSILEINADTKSQYKAGFLGPRLSLKSKYDNETIQNPAIGLIVYNLGNHEDFKYKGYTYWDGDEWLSFEGKNVNIAQISNLNCSNLTINPPTFIKDQYYNGTIKLFYNGGNGGHYSNEIIETEYGLTATLEEGHLEINDGFIEYKLEGIPTISESESIGIKLKLANKVCDSYLGIHEDLEVGEMIIKKYLIPINPSSVWLSNIVTEDELIILNNQLAIDIYYQENENTSTSKHVFPRLVNTKNKPVKLWINSGNNRFRLNTGNFIMAAKNTSSKRYIELSDGGLSSGLGKNDVLPTTSKLNETTTVNNSQESIIVDLIVDEKWYKIYITQTYDNLNTTTNTDNLRIIYITVERLD